MGKVATSAASPYTRHGKGTQWFGGVKGGPPDSLCCSRSTTVKRGVEPEVPFPPYAGPYVGFVHYIAGRGFLTASDEMGITSQPAGFALASRSGYASRVLDGQNYHGSAS